MALRSVNFSDSNFPKLMIYKDSLNEEITSISWNDLPENHTFGVHLTSTQSIFSYTIKNERNLAGAVEKHLWSVETITPLAKKIRISEGTLHDIYTKTSNNSLYSTVFAIIAGLSAVCTAAALYPSRPWYYPIFLKNPRAEKEIALFWGCVAVVSAVASYIFNNRWVNAKFELCKTLISMAVFAHNQKQNNDQPHVFTANNVIVHRPL